MTYTSTSRIVGAETEQTKNLRAARAIYADGYAFPAWVIGFSKDEALYKECCETVKIYTLKGSKNKEVLDLYTQRDLVNISMGKGYKTAEMKQTFGWDESYYSAYYKTHKKLAPQTIICCKTPVLYLDNNPSYKNEAFDPSKVIYANVINMIGDAFDNNQQPDYLHYLDENGHITNAKKNELYRDYINKFSMAWHYLCDQNKNGKGYESVVTAKFGCESFAVGYPGGSDQFMNEIWVPAYKYSLLKYAQELKDQQYKTIGFVRTSASIPKELHAFIEGQGFEVEYYGNIPTMFLPGGKLADKPKRDKTVVFNAYDNHSLGGNGNKSDPSLDGWWGRCSAIAALLWTKTNAHLDENAIHFIDPNTDASLFPPNKTSQTNNYVLVGYAIAFFISIMRLSPNQSYTPKKEKKRNKKRRKSEDSDDLYKD